MSDRCDLTDLLITSCACPQHRGGEVIEPAATAGQPFEAAYEGRCPNCDRPIHVGQAIVRLADDPGYVHAGRCL